MKDIEVMVSKSNGEIVINIEWTGKLRLRFQVNPWTLKVTDIKYGIQDEK